MIAVFVVVAWAGYGLGTYGYNLVRGYDITIVQWFDPFKPYSWPAGGPALVPRGRVFPGGGGGSSAGSTAAGGSGSAAGGSTAGNGPSAGGSEPATGRGAVLS